MLEYQYTYIIAPKNETNLAKLWEFITLYPNLVTEQRIKTVYTKSVEDVLSPDGNVLIYAGDMYYLLKATTADFNPSMLDGVIDPVLYNVDNLPFETMWL